MTPQLTRYMMFNIDQMYRNDMLDFLTQDREDDDKTAWRWHLVGVGASMPRKSR